VAWGFIPSILFFVVACLCFRQGMSLWLTLGLSFALWLAGAMVHHLLLSR
jgi:hypothetical protein